MKFGEFLDILQDDSKAGKWYLTTQYVEEGEDQQASGSSSSASGSETSRSAESDSEEDDNEPELDNVLPAPTNALSNDFPAKPQMLGDLVLQQCNLWLGNSKEGKSSDCIMTSTTTSTSSCLAISASFSSHLPHIGICILAA